MRSSLPRFPALALAAVFLAGSAALFAATPRSPNVVVILADDFGYGDVGFNGGKLIPTPGLDRIAAGGVVFTQAYLTHPTGSASRAGILTGRYPQRFGLERSVAWRPQDPTAGLPAEEKTLAEALRPLGYTSALIGKWHLGAHDAFHPNNRGFDEFYGFLGGSHHYFPKDLPIQHTYEARTEPESYRTWILRGMQPIRTERYLTEDFTVEAIDFVRRQHHKPFFLLLAYHAPRAPSQAPENEINAFAHIADKKRRTYAAMVSVMDRGIGQLLDVLDSLEIADDTLVFFLSTSGGDTQAGASNGALRGRRGEIHEGGIRVPFVARWPRMLPGGVRFAQPVSSMDIFATTAVAAGIAPDTRRPLDGVDLAPFVRGERQTRPHERLFVRVFDAGIHAVREGEFKLVKTKDTPEPLLFNLARDPAEKTNAAASDPDRLRKMQESFEAWNAQMIEPKIPGMDMREWKQPATR